jgi:hypothetical protein
MTFPTTILTVSDQSLAGPARQSGAQSPFWRHVQELLTLQRLHANSDDVLEIAMRKDLTDDERLQELERLAQRESKLKVKPMLQSTTAAAQNTNTLSAAEIARREAGDLEADVSRQISGKPQHIQMLAVSKALGKLIADTVITRQLGPVEGLLDEIESNLDFDNGTIVRQYARGLAALAEDIHCRLANI